MLVPRYQSVGVLNSRENGVVARDEERKRRVAVTARPSEVEEREWNFESTREKCQTLYSRREIEHNVVGIGCM